MKNHKDTSAPYCHYYNNQKECPFFKVGCMFKHERSGKCKFNNCSRKLCQFEHEEIEDVTNVEEHSSKDQDDAEDQVGCPVCECTFLDDV